MLKKDNLYTILDLFICIVPTIEDFIKISILIFILNL